MESAEIDREGMDQELTRVLLEGGVAILRSDPQLVKQARGQTEVADYILLREFGLLQAAAVIFAIAGENNASREYAGNKSRISQALATAFAQHLTDFSAEDILDRTQEYGQLVSQIGPSGVPGWELGVAFANYCTEGKGESELALVTLASGAYTFVLKESIEEVRISNSERIDCPSTSSKRGGCGKGAVALLAAVVLTSAWMISRLGVLRS